MKMTTTITVMIASVHQSSFPCSSIESCISTEKANLDFVQWWTVSLVYLHWQNIPRCSLRGLVSRVCWYQTPHTFYSLMIRRFIAKYRKTWKPQNMFLELSNNSDTWQAFWQQYCWGACKKSRRYYNFNHQSCSFESWWDLKIRRPLA